LNIADVKAFLVGGIVGGTVQAILNIMLLVGVLKVLLFKSLLIIACLQLHFTFTHITL
jgi:hypothetical protein